MQVSAVGTVVEMGLDSRHLDLLAALRDGQSLAAASEVINVSASAASRRLSDAERIAGVILATKVGRTIQLTAAGRLLADAALESRRVLAEAELAAGWIGSDSPPPVQIGLGFIDAVGWLLPHYHELAFEVVGSEPRATSGAAAPGRRPDVMITVLGQPEAEPGPLSCELGPDRLVLIVSTEHRLARQPEATAAAIAKLPYLAGSIDPLPGFEFERFFVPAGHSPTEITTIGSFSLLLDLVARGYGVTIQPARTLTDRADNRLTAVELNRPVPVAWVAKRHDGGTDRRVDQLCRLMATRFG